MGYVGAFVVAGAGDVVEEIEGALADFVGIHSYCEYISIICFCFVGYHHIGHNEAVAACAELGIAPMGKELHAGFVDDGEEGIVAEVLAIVNICDADRNNGCMQCFIVRKFYFYATH